MKHFPLNKEKVTITNDSNSYVGKDYTKETEIPIESHCGAFGVIRKFHTHEGIDLYCKTGDGVYAIENGEVILIEDFTGEKANPPSIWWNNTKAIHIKGESGIIVYGEVLEIEGLKEGDIIRQGDLIAKVTPVLKKDKGRPMEMLHLELYDIRYGNQMAYCWDKGLEKHEFLKNPTELILKCKINY